MAKETEKRMNYVAISRVDPYIKNIVESSTHVALYTFNSKANEWEKTDIEGALFVYERTAEPYHSIFINNRLNTNSLVEPITQFELQSQPPFLLYKNERSKIRGFWFYNSSECDRIGELIGKLVKGTQLKGPKPLKTTNNNVNILSMLSKAQEDFNKVTHVVPPVSKKEPINLPNMALNNPSVMNFFGAIPTDPISLQRLKPSVVPPVHTVDEIEKKHRANTPQNDLINSVNNSTNGIKNFRGTSPDLHGSELGSSPLVTFFNSVNLGNQPGLNKKNFPIVNAKAVSEIELAQTRPAEKVILNENYHQQKTTVALVNVGPKPALMPPTMFEATLKTTHYDNSSGDNLEAITPLSKDQMVSAMTYMLKNDSNFVHKLHEAYLKSIAQS